MCFYASMENLTIMKIDRKVRVKNFDLKFGFSATKIFISAKFATEVQTTPSIWGRNSWNYIPNFTFSIPCITQFNYHKTNKWTPLYQVKCTLVQALRLCTGRTVRRGSRGIALPFHDHGTRRGEGSASRPGRSLPPGKTRYPLYKRLGGPQGRSGQVRKISSPLGFDSRTVQPIASR